jgi:hypothetical protein
MVYAAPSETHSTSTKPRTPSRRTKALRSCSAQIQETNAMCVTKIYDASEKWDVKKNAFLRQMTHLGMPDSVKIVG